MKLLDLKINNFMRFKYEQSVIFPDDDVKNVMLIYGNNGAGKTCFLNALRWGFYGKAYTRHKAEISLNRIVNSESASEGNWNFSIELRFESEGNIYHLIRHAKVKSGITKPTNNQDYDVFIFLKKNDHQYSADEIESEINNIAPEKVSRFFLFDGELLQEYESLLDEKNQSGEQIKNAIEQVLGVPALINGRNECDALLKNTTKILNKELANQKGFEIIAKSQLALTSRQESFLNDLKALKIKLKEIRDDKNIIDDQIDDLILILDEAKKIHTLKADKKSTESEQVILKEDLLKESALAWKALLKPRLIDLEKKLLNNFEDKMKHVSDYGAFRKTLENLEFLQSASKCPVCDSDVTQSNSLSEKISETKKVIENLSFDIEGISKSGYLLSTIRGLLNSSSYENLLRIGNKISDNEVLLVRIDNSISELESKLDLKSIDEIKKKKIIHENLILQEGSILKDIQNVEFNVNEISKQLEDLSIQIKANNSDSYKSKVSIKSDILSALKNAFSDSVDLLRDKLRLEVEENATKAFRSLISEKEYVQLKINNNYGLTIQDNRGSLVDLRSAGQEEIVALALIDGLSRTGRKSGPVVMDTPFGRIDGAHRTSILKYLPESAKQLILLVHDREIDRNKDLSEISHKIGKQYELVNKNSRYTKIEAL